VLNRLAACEVQQPIILNEITKNEKPRVQVQAHCLHEPRTQNVSVILSSNSRINKLRTRKKMSNEVTVINFLSWGETTLHDKGTQVLLLCGKMKRCIIMWLQGFEKKQQLGLAEHLGEM